MSSGSGTNSASGATQSAATVTGPGAAAASDDSALQSLSQVESVHSLRRTIQDLRGALTDGGVLQEEHYPLHYVVVLDGSGSMGSKLTVTREVIAADGKRTNSQVQTTRWLSQKHAYETWLEQSIIVAKEAGNHGTKTDAIGPRPDRVSTIIFCDRDKTNVLCSFVPLTEAKENVLPDEDSKGGTVFAVALEKVMEELQKSAAAVSPSESESDAKQEQSASVQQYTPVMIFMSDGEDTNSAPEVEKRDVAAKQLAALGESRGMSCFLIGFGKSKLL
jgi:hypothetical protein